MIHFLQVNFLFKVLVLHTDRTKIGQVGGLLLFVREDVPSRILNPKTKTDTETFSVEVNLRKRKLN